MKSASSAAAPIIALLLLAPFIAEVLYGGTRVSFIFVFIPQVGAWGCGALIIRHIARARRLGWPSILLLGVALGLAEECVIQQTSLAPMIGLAKAEYGRVWGVNWVYLTWALGYWSVWVALLPAQLVDLMYPKRRSAPWFGTRGLLRACLSFGIASFMAWFMWTQRARVKVFHMPPYNPPALQLALAVAAILLIILTALVLPVPRRSSRRAAPAPWLVGTVACLLGIPWGAFVLLGFGAYPQVPYRFVILGAGGLAGLTLFLMLRWTTSATWNDAHRFALVYGGVMACMLSGFVMFRVLGAIPVDWIGKAVLNIAAAVWLARLSRQVSTESSDLATTLSI
ncbi:MAG TPA: hypothetical protein VKU01_33815 [Bryobacteraceae bacterium]|nr:hypothetical protein [Bryobacteraceae bacterium]